ncbi:D-psicose/D-tagatose/L-ribulose 3-epimerase [Chryseobacterium soldanellicola]|uniref:D-psicose/D-tagatose/L-ribulose 3-epimerase n=1 Tax=Chryseobacterium soldanellicola TaxID=311333 RepID=A0A1H1GLK8_9FLAO|nr:sugar phosphate isomerase/epimerase family protein [Chryseobacterium soldanellicola]SDR13756.1 D-psicose/D-tagatose/L-ribulose 3-epimerase [Chryseobacterium soldanellicola]
MKIKFGASLLSWITPVWNPEAGKYAIEKTANAGFDLIEILLPSSMEFNAKEVKQQLKDNNLEAACSLNLPKEAHIAFYPKAAESLIKQAIDKASELETDFLGGVLHGGIGVFSGNPLTENESEIIAEVWSNMADYAKEKGVNIGIEPINRYETYVCNTAKNVLDLISKTGKDNLFLHLDTFHMNIEENNFYDPIILAGKKLKHIHMTESHRGMLGEGTVNWNELFKALKEINFEGNLVLENFSSSVPGMQQMVSLWQKSPHNAQELASGSLEFMKNHIIS